VGNQIGGKKLIRAGITNEDLTTMFAAAGDVETFLKMAGAEVDNKPVKVKVKMGEYAGAPRAEIESITAAPDAPWAVQARPGGLGQFAPPVMPAPKAPAAPAPAAPAAPAANVKNIKPPPQPPELDLPF
jgi:hypothetical protein